MTVWVAGALAGCTVMQGMGMTLELGLSQELRLMKCTILG